MLGQCLAPALLLALATTAFASNQTLFTFDDLVDIKGNPTDLAQFKGNVTLVINVASF